MALHSVGAILHVAKLPLLFFSVHGLVGWASGFIGRRKKDNKKE